jgi:hypothetical protein
MEGKGKVRKINPIITQPTTKNKFIKKNIVIPMRFT